MLSKVSKTFLQRLVAQENGGKASLILWLTTSSCMNDLLTVDPKLLVTPPEYVKHGSWFCTHCSLFLDGETRNQLNKVQKFK